MASLDGKVSIDVVIKDIVSRPLAHGVIFGAPACELAALRQQLADTQSKLAALESDIAEGRLIRIEESEAWAAVIFAMCGRLDKVAAQPDPATDNIAAAFRSTDTWRG